MNNSEFKTKLAEAFKSHIIMRDRDYHTVNELLYVLEHDARFGKEDFNISVKTKGNSWLSIPTLEAFVDVRTRGVCFKDADIEFETEEFNDMIFNCITVSEKLKED